MKIDKLKFFFSTLFMVMISFAHAEGTKSIWKTFTGLGINDESGGLLVNYISDPVNGSYPAYTFNSTSDERMYVHIRDFNTESIKFGFNVRRLWFTSCDNVPNVNGDYTSANTGGRRVHWRLKNPNGVVVATSGANGIPYWNGGTTPSTTPGFIGTYNEAVNGPDNFNGVGTAGYTPITHTPTMNGDYYFEFNYTSNSTMFDISGCTWATMEFNYFDISVARGTNTVNGRLWSRQWSLLTVNRAPNAGAAALSENSSRFHIYTSDSIITKVELDKVVPGYFNVIANENGVGTTGNFANDSKSTTSPAVALNRLNRIFLNTPDTNIYPARALTRSVSPVYIQRCSQDDQCIIVDLNRESSANLYIEVNGVPGYQASTSDRLISTTSLPRGVNCIPWDGRDGNGTLIPDGDTIFVQVLFESNVTQVPLQDIESNPNGLKISLELPISGSTAVYWDDSNVGGTTNLTGCVGSAITGCHTWTGNFSSGIGNGNVINSYWYSTLDTLVAIPIKDSTFTINIVDTDQDASCSPASAVDPGNINLTNFGGNPATNFRWTTTGTGTFLPHDSTLFADYLPSAQDVEFGGIVKLFLSPKVGCPDATDSILIDLGNRPGGVSADILSWFKANNGPRNGSNNPATNGQVVKSWRNKALLGNDATAVSVGPVYSENMFNFNPGIVFSDNDNQRMTFPVDFGTSVSGSGTYLSANSISIDNGTNANGVPDGVSALVDNDADRLVLDFGQTVPAGTSYRLTWRRKSTYPFGAVADMVVEESLSPGSGYTANPIIPQTGSITTFVTTVLVTQSSTRYIRLYPQTGTNDDFDFDAVTYSRPARQSETIFLVAKKSNNTANAYLNGGSSDDFRSFFGESGGNPRFRFEGTGTTVTASPTVPNNEAFISAYQLNLNGNEKVVYNGITSYNANFGNVNPVSSFIIGNNSTNSAELAGAVAEVIVYADAISDIEIQRVETYLAVKYGITLNRNYLNSDGTVVFTADGGGSTIHDNDIAGIGREECAINLVQLKSISQNTDAVVQMSAASSLDEKDYLIWGNDNGSLATKNTVDVDPTIFTERIQRVWKSQATGDPGEVTVAFYLGNISGAPTDIKKYGLIKGASPTMANASLNSYNKFISNDTLYFEGVPFNGIQYFSLATELVDWDNDGVADANDLDSDNDGILDADEVSSCSGNLSYEFYSGAVSGSTVNSIPFSGAAAEGVINNFNVSALATSVQGSADNYSIRYKGFINITTAGNYTFYTTSDDGSKLYIAGNEIVDNDGAHATQERSGQINLSVGTYPITILFFENSGGDELSVSYEGPSISKQLVPFARFRSECDSDGDGIPNYLDLDSDNDGILDIYESGIPLATIEVLDANNDGIIDPSNTFGFNGFADGLETTPNSGLLTYQVADDDGDGINNQTDLDSDNDGITDLMESGVGTDANNDGIIDGTTDLDNDGVIDSADSNTSAKGSPGSKPDDTDGDGRFDFQDLDSDNDGITDLAENGVGTDANNDGVIDGNADADSDGILDSADSNDSALGSPNSDPRDTDGDGIPNQKDLDSDNDGITDLAESGVGTDSNNDGIVDGTADADGDGILDSADSNDASFGSPNTIATDTDSDGLANAYDLDADNDGLTDLSENPNGTGVDTNNDGVIDGTADADGDGILDSADSNDGSQGSPNTTPTNSDLDSTPNYLDLDSDNDGIFDIQENGNGSDSNNDGIVDGSSDTDNDGILNSADNNNAVFGSPNSAPRDSDGDGRPNNLDLDSDNDGITDLDENPNSTGVDANNDGVIDGTADTDGDGILNSADSNDGVVGSPNSPVSNVDGDALPNFIDLDADNDGITDLKENPNGIGADTNNDGIVDGTADSDGDGILNSADSNDGVIGSPNTTPTNSDTDGNPNFLDLDSDNDGIVDLFENQGNGNNDANNDGIIDGTADSDNDGILDPADSNDGVSGSPNNTLLDSDTDGVPNVLDLDSDNDGITDLKENPNGTGTDNNNDGVVDGTADSDDDGILNSADSNDGTFGSPNSAPSNNDGDGLANFLDLDSDNDGITDLKENSSGTGVDANNDGIVDGIADSDSDGVLNSADSNDGAIGSPNTVPTNSDNDAIPNFLDLDSDNDGITDLFENQSNLADDTNNDGIVDGSSDADNDGILDQADSNDSQLGSPNTSPLDTDTDGRPNFIDIDSDNDGITDLTENPDGTGVDGNNDGVVDGTADSDSDGVLNSADSNDGAFGSPSTTPQDFDNDGLANFIDIDADNDGIIDNIEAQVTSGSPIRALGNDSDNDGLDNAFESTNGLQPVNTDAADNPDYLDLDSDNDLLSDLIEGWDTDGDFVANTDPSGSDTDNDGLDNSFDDVNGRNATTNPSNDAQNANDFPNNSISSTSERDWREITDRDGDGIADNIDIDDDNDGILDGDENSSCDKSSSFVTNEDAFWTLDNNTNDVSGNGNNERPNGNAPSFSSIAYQGSHSANFNGTSNTIRYNQNGGFMEGNYTEISFSAWIRPSSIVGSRVIYEEGGTTNGIMLSLVSGNLRGTARNGGAGSQTNVNISNTLNVGEWAHVALTFDNGIMTIYLNGVISNSVTCSFSSIPSHTDDGGIGGPIESAPNGFTGFYAGLMDAVRYSNSEAWSKDDIVSEATFQCDTDGDGIADQFDLDSDNDGIADIIEAGGVDSNNDGRVDNDTDNDNDGWANTFDPDNSGTPLADLDSDGDGIRNRYDLDSDDDGIQDVLEAGGIDTNNDGQVDSSTDTNFNGWADNVDPTNGGSALPLTNTDNDALPDYIDRDSDNDGLSDTFEAGGTDTTNDGIVDGLTDNNDNGWNDAQESNPHPLTNSDSDSFPDYRDKDSDGDGITDALEAGGVDANGDGELDSFVDSDNDGLINGNDGTPPTKPNKDGDSRPDYLDLDSDNDGIADVIEAGGEDVNNDGEQDGLDADFDGLSDDVDTDNAGTRLPLTDFDGDGLPNYLDIDSDNDGLIDNVEGQSTAAFVAPTGADTDNDGWDNRYDSDNGGTAITLNNQESNGNPDYIDLDTDGDGQPDWIEGFDDDENGLATDGDALNDYLNRATAIVAARGNTILYNNALDSDSDGIPNWLEDADLDGQPNFIDPQSTFYQDTDNDGLIDLFDTDNFGVPSTYPNKDNDLEPDWRDTDNATTLPISLLSFDAEKKVSDVLLKWITLSEINNDFFTVEKSKDGESFVEVGKVDGAGNFSGRLEYKLLDESPYNGVSYYRLKQTDFNGDYTYSELRAVEFGVSQIVESSALYPNPTAGEQLFFNLYSKEQGELALAIRTFEGQLITTRKVVLDGYATNYELELLRGLSLAKGSYLVTYEMNEKVIGTKRFIVK
jgi:hypothetical protein